MTVAQKSSFASIDKTTYLIGGIVSKNVDAVGFQPTASILVFTNGGADASLPIIAEKVKWMAWAERV